MSSEYSRTLMSWLAQVWANVLFSISTTIHSGLPAFLWIRPKWSIEHMPNQSGKVRRWRALLGLMSQVVVVTGGNSGTGYACCKAFYERGAKVYMASRSADKAQEAIEAIKSGRDFGFNRSIVNGSPKLSRASGMGELIFLEIDLTDLHSVDSFVKTLQS